jgi:transcriptional regulator with XRE-family HTH domain
MKMDALPRRLGQRIKALRRGRAMTQERLAERAEISVSFLSMIEGGRRVPHLSTLARLAGGLGLPLFELFSFDGTGARAAPRKPKAA